MPFQWQEGQVAARSLGLAPVNLAIASGQVYSPSNEAPSWWISGNLECTGEESSLHYCSFGSWCSGFCTSGWAYPSYSEAAIQAAPAVRFSVVRSSQTGTAAGDLEYYINGEWCGPCGCRPPGTIFPLIRHCALLPHPQAPGLQ